MPRSRRYLDDKTPAYRYEVTPGKYRTPRARARALGSVTCRYLTSLTALPRADLGGALPETSGSQGRAEGPPEGSLDGQEARGTMPAGRGGGRR